MTRLAKAVTGTIGVTFSVCFIYYMWYNIMHIVAAGSYPNGERYTINVDEATLINAIKRFKEENPQYTAPLMSFPSDTAISYDTKLEDDTDKLNRHFFYFYYTDDTQVIFTFTYGDSEDKTTFAFVGINQGRILSNWKDVNQPFTYFESRKMKKKFEQRILNPIIKMLPPAIKRSR